ncbi:NAD-dependent epimerase/dehydratase family protein [Lachnospiraceae bacterium MD335]|nr:NAD-dependent epimerase/dehydratase family protein [Lachnospiraceae bacterium MD335]
MKLLITGFSGFVSQHFLNFLEENAEDAEVCGIDINKPTFDYGNYKNIQVKFYTVNLLEPDTLNIILDIFRPEFILHLASFSSVAYSWKHPIECFNNNTNIFLNIVDTVHKLKLNCRILSVGSSEEYGNVTEQDIPLFEENKVLPCSPYAVARVSQEMLSNLYVNSYGLDIVMTRSFNHIGPLQDTRFVIPSFITRILKIKQEGKQEGTIETGDLSIIRDFVDVRDVVKAYYNLLVYGKIGELYNICSGKGIALRDIVNMISNITGIRVNTVINSEYIRVNDNHIIIGSYEKIEKDIGWRPIIPIEKTLRDMVGYYEKINDNGCYKKFDN